MIVLSGQWNRWVRLVYRVAREQVVRLLPEDLQPDEPECCEIHVAQLSRLRPAGLPLLCGIECVLVLYCLRARLTPDGEPWLYCLRVDADPRILSVVGPLAPEFGFHPAEIGVESLGSYVQLRVNDQDGSGNATLRWETPRANAAAESAIYSSHLLSRWNQGGFLLAEAPFADAAPPLPLRVTNERWPVLQHLGLQTARRIEASLCFPQFECSWIFGERRVLPSNRLSLVQAH